jgi:hypothetical protein
LDAIGAMSVCIRLGRQAGGRLEEPMEIARAHFHCPRQLIQVRELVGLFDHPASGSYHLCVLFRQARAFGVATLTRAESGFFRFLGGFMERDVFAIRPP